MSARPAPARRIGGRPVPTRYRRLVGTGAVAVLAAALGACSAGGTANAGSGSGAGYVGPDGTITVLTAAERGAPVAISGTTIEGRRLDLATMRGKVIVLNVWGSWCPPCRKEAPDLQRAYTALQPRGVEFVGLDVDDQAPQATAYQKAFGVTYPSLADDGGKSLLALRGAVSAKTLPATLVLDRQGRIAVRISDVVTTSTLTDLVDDVVGGRVPQA
jgi:thiol-disulfide isomerase/thioredoxin